VPVPSVVPSVPGVTGGGPSSSPSSGGGGSSSSGPPSSGSSGSAPSSSAGGSARTPASVARSSATRGARARAARTPAARRHHRRSERKLRRAVTRLSGCLDRLTAVQERVLVLRAGVGAARPHSRRGVARKLDLRLSRVRRIERRGLRSARALARDGGCGGSGGGGGSGTSTVAGGAGGSSGLIAPPTAPEAAAGDGDPSSGASERDSGSVRGESEEQLPPPLENPPGRSEEPGGLSLAIGIALILLALLAGFATPHLRARLRSDRPA
jgi:hypothetical protein